MSEATPSRDSERVSGDTSPGAPALVFGDLEFTPWRVQFEVDDGRLRTLPTPRPGFRYGHSGHGRDAIAITHLGAEDWTDYEVELDFSMLDVDPECHPYFIPPGTERGFYLYFRLQDFAESWNEPGLTGYRIAFNANGNWNLTRYEGHYCPVPSGYVAPPPGTGRHLAAGQGSAPIESRGRNHVRLRVEGSRMQVWLNQHPLVDMTERLEPHEHPIRFGGIALSWRYESMGWAENLVIRRL